MDSCSCCGSFVPEGQGVCSMCYGDPHFGRDGYYQSWIDEQHQKMQEEQEREEQERSVVEIEPDLGLPF